MLHLLDAPGRVRCDASQSQRCCALCGSKQRGSGTGTNGWRVRLRSNRRRGGTGRATAAAVAFGCGLVLAVALITTGRGAHPVELAMMDGATTIPRACSRSVH